MRVDPEDRNRAFYQLKQSNIWREDLGGCSCVECGREGSQKKVCCCLKDSGASRLCSPVGPNAGRSGLRKLQALCSTLPSLSLRAAELQFTSAAQSVSWPSSVGGWSQSSTEYLRQHGGPLQTEWNLYHMYQASQECVAHRLNQRKELQKAQWKAVSENRNLCVRERGMNLSSAIFWLSVQPRPIPPVEQTQRSLLADLQQFFTGKLYVVVYQLKLPAEELLWLALSWHIRGGNPEVKALWVKARILPDR
ncbi:hypothetical protein IRJ41_013453 [Triplophysa rosa]|uniref:Uncharacterized protein n=1 Tax=Triplophysa rosa TaxID=992332 RepID=A0A9W7TRH7_TRIRA|nr:hypothetical protein IRJ41_013453 [Triplophysa rosa]